MKLTFTFLMLIGIAVQINAQTKPRKQVATGNEVLTNTSVINLHKAGLDDDLIITKIQSADTKFDLSTDKLVELKTAGIGNSVIKAIMNKTNGSGTDTDHSAKPEPTPKSALGSFAAVDMINQVYCYTKGSDKVTPLEKSAATLKIKRMMMGMGGTSILYVINGAKSTVRFTTDEADSFVINTAGAAPEMTLYSLTVTNNGRQAVTQKSGAMSANIVASDDILSFNIQLVKPGIYQMTPATKLGKGEYFFASKPLANATTLDVFAFGIN